MEDEKVKKLVNKTKKEFQKYTGDEDIRVEYTNGSMYAFGSELATLRLFHAYRNTWKIGKAAVGYSQTYNSFYFWLEM